MKPRLRALLAGGIALVIAMAVGIGVYTQLARPHAHPLKGDTLPPGLHLADLQGTDHAFAQWHGKLLLVNFWATWCQPCRNEIPLLERMQARYGSRGLQVIGPAADDVRLVTRDAAGLQFNYPVLVGDIDTVTRMMDALGNDIGALPFSVLVGPTGDILDRRLGAYSERDLDQLVSQNLPG